MVHNGSIHPGRLRHLLQSRFSRRSLRRVINNYGALYGAFILVQLLCRRVLLVALTQLRHQQHA